MPRTHDMERAGQDIDIHIGRTGTTGVNREVFSCLICHFIQSATLTLTRYILYNLSESPLYLRLGYDVGLC